MVQDAVKQTMDETQIAGNSVLDVVHPALPEYEGSGTDAGKKFTKCGTCKYGAECDEDSEDVW